MNAAEETRYFIDFDKGTLNRFTINHDYYAESPRNPDFMSNVGTMSLDQFQSENGKTADETLDYLCSMIPNDVFFKYLKEHEQRILNDTLENTIQDIKDHRYYGYYYSSDWTKEELNEVVQDCIIGGFCVTEKIEFINKLQKDSPFIALPLDYRQYSTASNGNVYIQDLENEDFYGIDGYIYATKEDCVKEWSKDDWREKGSNYLKSEIEDFNMYLDNEIYEYKIDEQDNYYNNNGDVIAAWKTIDSCSDFYSKKRGDELVKDILKTACLNIEPLFEKIPEFITKKTTLENFQSSLKEIINCLSDVEKKEIRKYDVGIWSGAGYSLDVTTVKANNEVEALDKTIVELEKQKSPLLLDVENTQSKGIKDGIFDSKNDSNPLFDVQYLYIDATMEGANSPYYINAQNLKIVPKEKSLEYSKDTLQKCSAFLINNMSKTERQKLNKVFKTKGCSDEKSLTSFLNKLATDEEKLVKEKSIQKERKISKEVERGI